MRNFIHEIKILISSEFINYISQNNSLKFPQSFPTSSSKFPIIFRIIFLKISLTLKFFFYKFFLEFFRNAYRVKRPLLARVPSLARFFVNLTEIVCWIFFFHWSCQHCCVWCYHTVKKKKKKKKNSLWYDYKKPAIPYQ